MDRGSAPYSRNVKMAPSTLPSGCIASATAIISTTYIQAIATKYMSYGENMNYNVKIAVITR